MRASARELAKRLLLWAARSVGGVAQSLPLRLQVAIHEQLQPIGVLDLDERPVRMHADSDVEYMMRLHACSKEPETIEWLREFARSGLVMFDVGANVGSYALAAREIAPSQATVVAFEPSAINFGQLLRNIALNGAEGHLIPINIALGARSELLEFSYSSLTPGAALHDVVRERDERISHPMFVYALDDVVMAAALPPPTMMKIDVDGLEAEILQGAAATLRSESLKTVLIELQQGEIGRQVTDLLLEAGLSLRSTHSHGAGAAANAIFVRP